MRIEGEKIVRWCNGSDARILKLGTLGIADRYLI